ncbi:acyl-CoA thioester hydrolase/BAAT C-terminal domain-containing protein [Phytohabitans sp. LJ34]|uniref:acyl-CoA thioester hydrolase/BAAT C-terminal domain-containing protein n=1 Tax=Phytohabitans sp. LJ34 TaxID=3452217 RepID=UPI003F890962
MPVSNVEGPVLAIAGGEDNPWPSTPQAQAIQPRLHADAAKATVEVLTYPAAGHGAATYPFQPAGVVGVHPVDGRTYHHGGTRAANAAARSDSRSRVIAFRADLP